MKIGLKKILETKTTEITLVLIIISSISYDGLAYWSLFNKNIALENRVSMLEDVLAQKQKNLSALNNENTVLNDSLRTEKANNDFFQGQIQNIAGTVGVLEKLSKTDPELLKKYSKVYFLNENYIPPKLTDIDQKYLNIKEKPQQIHAEVWPHLQKLLETAQMDGLTLQIISAYRSFGTQATLKSSYKVTYGAGTANKFSADQGYSEHQLGTTVDFTTPTIGNSFVGFDKTNEYKWLIANAYKYGFTMSYPKENTYYAFEPWHFRFVGVALATKLHEQNTYFYALDQRDIDQYLVNFFD